MGELPWSTDIEEKGWVGFSQDDQDYYVDLMEDNSDDSDESDDSEDSDDSDDMDDDEEHVGINVFPGLADMLEARQHFDMEMEMEMEIENSDDDDEWSSDGEESNGRDNLLNLVEMEMEIEMENSDVDEWSYGSDNETNGSENESSDNDG